MEFSRRGGNLIATAASFEVNNLVEECSNCSVATSILSCVPLLFPRSSVIKPIF